MEEELSKWQEQPIRLWILNTMHAHTDLRSLLVRSEPLSACCWWSGLSYREYGDSLSGLFSWRSGYQLPEMSLPFLEPQRRTKREVPQPTSFKLRKDISAPVLGGEKLVSSHTAIIVMPPIFPPCPLAYRKAHGTNVRESWAWSWLKLELHVLQQVISV